jgi:hypothetical protein
MHPASPEQIEAGVINLDEGLEGVKRALQFETPSSSEEITARAEFIASAAVVYKSAMIGGALWLMAPLAAELRARDIEPLFAFSQRESVETVGADGAVTKTNVFRHVGFVPAVVL